MSWSGGPCWKGYPAEISWWVSQSPASGMHQAIPILQRENLVAQSQVTDSVDDKAYNEELPFKITNAGMCTGTVMNIPNLGNSILI